MRMTREPNGAEKPADDAWSLFDSARWYDLGINWEARLGREMPVLRNVFGPPGGCRLLDAGCGPGHHLVAFRDAGYDVTGLDASESMLELARERLRAAEHETKLIASRFEELAVADSPFTGLYCLGNSLAAAGSADRVEASVRAFAGALAPGGRLFIQLLNFATLRAEKPAIRGPRVRRDGDRDYISSRVYTFSGSEVEVTNLTLWYDGKWQQTAHAGSLYAVSAMEMEQWFQAYGLRIDAMCGSYALDAYDPDRSNDLIVVGTKTAE